MNYVVAVRGGVDSVVLLDMMSRLPDVRLIVAHFNHGIRNDAEHDARFVERLAEKYGAAFETAAVALGPEASEDEARRYRYAFLRKLAKRYGAQLVTAHHSDDLVESVVINVTRGTGWRGLAVMNSDVLRPLLGMTKQELIDYALKHGLEWHEDSTNASDKYLRNRIRRRSMKLPRQTKEKVADLRQEQVRVRKEIEAEVKQLVGEGPTYERYFFIHAPAAAALECLKVVTGGRLTRPQLERALLTIKAAKPRSTYQAGGKVELHFTPRQFVVELIK